jgi:hypothetical protein
LLSGKSFVGSSLNPSAINSLFIALPHSSAKTTQISKHSIGRSNHMKKMLAQSRARRWLLPRASLVQSFWSKSPTQRPRLLAETTKGYKQIPQCGLEAHSFMHAQTWPKTCLLARVISPFRLLVALRHLSVNKRAQSAKLIPQCGQEAHGIHACKILDIEMPFCQELF